MSLLIRSFIIIMLGLSLTACSKKLSSDALPANVSQGGTYYTQVVMHYEKNVHPTTNYQVGATIPVNTQIKLIEMNDKTISVEVGTTGQKLTVKNFSKHTGDDIHQAFNKLFGKQQVDLTQFTKLEREHIDASSVAKGMRKKAVLVAIGYPPNTRTANLEANSWVYWRHRYNTFSVNFKNDKVVEIVD